MQVRDETVILWERPETYFIGWNNYAVVPSINIAFDQVEMVLFVKLTMRIPALTSNLDSKYLSYRTKQSSLEKLIKVELPKDARISDSRLVVEKDFFGVEFKRNRMIERFVLVESCYSNTTNDLDYSTTQCSPNK